MFGGHEFKLFFGIDILATSFIYKMWMYVHIIFSNKNSTDRLENVEETP